MKKKDERIADLGLKQLGVNPQIHHFETEVGPFTAITIAEDALLQSYENRIMVRRIIDKIVWGILPSYPHEKATKLRSVLAKRNIFGVSICDSRDYFNRQRGRTIAKGRLLKHLKQLKKRSEENARV